MERLLEIRKETSCARSVLDMRATTRTAVFVLRTVRLRALGSVLLLDSTSITSARRRTESITRDTCIDSVFLVMTALVLLIGEMSSTIAVCPLFLCHSLDPFSVPIGYVHYEIPYNFVNLPIYQLKDQMILDFITTYMKHTKGLLSDIHIAYIKEDTSPVWT